MSQKSRSSASNDGERIDRILARQEKISDWIFGVMIVAVLLLFIFGTIVHLFWL